MGDTGLEPVTPSCKGGALPTELIALMLWIGIISIMRFQSIYFYEKRLVVAKIGIKSDFYLEVTQVVVK